MTDEQAIRALVDTARQWAETDSSQFSAYGQGYCAAMKSILPTLSHCPTGAAAIRGDAETVECRKKARRTGKAGRIGGKGRKTRSGLCGLV